MEVLLVGMPMNKSVVGKEYPHVSYEITKEMIVKYAEVVEDPSPYFSDAGAEILYAPHTMVGAYTLLLVPYIVTDKELDLDITKPIVHVHQMYAWKRSARAGDVLTIRGRIAEIFSRNESEYITFEGDIIDQEGRHVVVARSTLKVG